MSDKDISKNLTLLEVLAVDDEPGMLMGISRSLESFKVVLADFNIEVGFNITRAECGKDVEDIINKKNIDIFLLDYKLPDTTGLMLLERINNKVPNAICIIITAYASIEIAVSATKNGAFDFLAKPFSPVELRSVMQKATRTMMLEREAKKLAKEKKSIRFDFISVIAHELKAPVAAVEGYINMIKNRHLGDDLTKYDKALDRSKIRVVGMQKLINDLLDMTRIESGKKKRDLQDINVLDIIEESVETVAADAEKRGIVIEMDVASEISVNCDRGELEIIFNNLITNAVKYNRDNGRVFINCKKEESSLIIKVRDTGIGMSSDDCTKLFGEFVRIKTSETKNIEGTGLGLSILKKLSDLYRGSVSVNSDLGKGSEFCVILNNI